MDRDAADVTCCGRPFHTSGRAATGKALSPMIDRRGRRTTSDDDDAERRRRGALKSAYWQSSSAMYGGATPCRHLYTRTASVNFNQFSPPPVQLTVEWSDVVIPRRKNTSWAAEFITNWSCFSRYCGIPARMALPWFSRVRTRDAASDWNTRLEADRRTLRSCRSSAKQQDTVFVTCDLTETSASI